MTADPRAWPPVDPESTTHYVHDCGCHTFCGLSLKWRNTLKTVTLGKGLPATCPNCDQKARN